MASACGTGVSNRSKPLKTISKKLARVFHYVRLRLACMQARKPPSRVASAEGGETPDWSQLPIDLLRLISENIIDMFDYVHFRAVCMSWRSAASAKPYHLPLQLPWLMLPYDPESQSRTFYSVSRRKFHRFELPEARGKLVCGSSHGWLVLLDRTGGLALLNPLTRAQVHLPPATHEFARASGFHAFALGNLIGGDPIVAGSLANSQMLAFCRPMDEAWATADTSLPYSVISHAFYNGLIYAIDIKGNVAVCDVATKEATVVPSLKVSIHFHRCHLVESSGELFLVVCTFVESLVAKDILIFDVFKCNPNADRPEWSRIQNTSDCTFFLSVCDDGSCICYRGFPGHEGNWIYISDPRNLDDVPLFSEDHYMGKMRVERRVWKRLHDWRMPSKVLEGSLWLAPSFCQQDALSRFAM